MKRGLSLVTLDGSSCAKAFCGEEAFDAQGDVAPNGLKRKLPLSNGDGVVALGMVPCRRRASAPFSAIVDNGVEEPPLKRNKGNSGDGRRNSVPFRRVTEDSVRLDPRLADNSFDAKPKAQGSWGERANRDFRFTQGKTFKHEKTKKKRGAYFGGSLSTDVCSYKFED
ncbi:unnamed protein product [Echinostoma caproni]|uniref:SRP40_C domain-containing protein n=1 Tax=Echinostoma caproni TaxID=27848 RepID=A0A183B2W6_9TREM|nr:unnamed protein product [Echinostoma caproni]